jgi:hypothetical protein
MSSAGSSSAIIERICGDEASDTSVGGMREERDEWWARQAGGAVCGNLFKPVVAESGFCVI